MLSLQLQRLQCSLHFPAAVFAGKTFSNFKNKLSMDQHV